ncbi:MAG TPA: hypothetical protein VFN35_25205 [Ktedonobacteraceae bacterium]|nr:hypothetical protein [Ktedonobacteraceae bacterium]
MAPATRVPRLHRKQLLRVINKEVSQILAYPLQMEQLKRRERPIQAAVSGTPIASVSGRSPALQAASSSASASDECEPGMRRYERQAA